MKRIIVGLGLVAMLSSCSTNSDPNYFGTIRPKHMANEAWLDASTEPQYIDPAKASDSISSGISTNMFLRLTQSNPKSGEPFPDLATIWNVSSDGREYTFFLRKDAVWSDGQPITADDVVWSWKRLADSATGSTYSQMADVIENARPFREQAIEISNLDGNDVSGLKLKLQKIVPIKDVTFDEHQKTFFAFIDSDDGNEKNEFRKKLIQEIESGSFGKGIHAKITSSDVLELKALDDHTVWVRLAHPAPYFLGLIEYVAFAPVPRHILEKFKSQGNEDLWVRPGNIVVSGPFILTEEEFKQFMIFKKNDKYFNASKIRLDQIKLVMIEDYHANLNGYKTGQHDWSFGASLPTDMTESLHKYQDYHHDAQLGVYYYMLNTKHKPLNDVRVRKAMSLAIDRKLISEKILKEGQMPSADLVPEGIPIYTGPQSPIHDSELAKKLLAEAGYPNGKGFPKMTLKYNTSEAHKKIAEAIQQMWKSTLGIQVDIQNMEWRSLLEDQNRDNFDMMRMAWIGDYLDPHTFLSIFLSESDNNHTAWKSAKYDKLLWMADGEFDPRARMGILVDAESILSDEAPILPIYHYTRSYMKKPYLKGFWPEYQDRHPWKYMWIDERWYNGVPKTADDPDEPWTE